MRARARAAGPDFVTAVRGEHVKVIAEVKRRSPSRGEINAQLNPASRARDYARGGAAAISVLTEPAHFGGSERDLVDVREVVRLPVLRKDFIIDEAQIIEARAWGASAVLLIARALPPDELRALAHAARQWQVEPFIEVRDEQELEAALAAGARAVGVNSRNLETLEVDPGVIDRLLPTFPADVIGIAESGMATRADVERAATSGADAVLVGSVLSSTPDPAATVRMLATVERRGR